MRVTFSPDKDVRIREYSSQYELAGFCFAGYQGSMKGGKAILDVCTIDDAVQNPRRLHLNHPTIIVRLHVQVNDRAPGCIVGIPSPHPGTLFTLRHLSVATDW